MHGSALSGLHWSLRRIIIIPFIRLIDMTALGRRCAQRKVFLNTYTISIEYLHMYPVDSPLELSMKTSFMA